MFTPLFILLLLAAAASVEAIVRLYSRHCADFLNVTQVPQSYHDLNTFSSLTLLIYVVSVPFSFYSCKLLTTTLSKAGALHTQKHVNQS